MTRHDGDVASVRFAIFGGVRAWRGDVELVRGDEVVHTFSRIAAIRTVMLNHSIHHRGQLTVYLRLLDVPLPAIYGSSAEERAF